MQTFTVRDRIYVDLVDGADDIKYYDKTFAPTQIKAEFFSGEFSRLYISGPTRLRSGKLHACNRSEMDYMIHNGDWLVRTPPAWAEEWLNERRADFDMALNGGAA